MREIKFREQIEYYIGDNFITTDVVFKKGSKEYFFGAMEIDKCEVVGNIYENRD